MRFHKRCGDRVSLIHEETTAVRNFVEFNHGLILSAEPLRDNIVFEVRIDRKVNVWNGGLEVGVTTLDPETLELPATASKLRNTAWIMSGNSIVKDGVTLLNTYGTELDSLREGDVVGVMRSSKGELIFYINGKSLGVAAEDLPPRVFAVIDLYGQCVQVSIAHTSGMRSAMESSLEQIDEDPINDHTLTSSEDMLVPETSSPLNLPPSQEEDEVCISIPEEEEEVEEEAEVEEEGADIAVGYTERIRFHDKCGILVSLSQDNKSAERTRPLDDYNNGVVMTNRPLCDNELFEIRIDKLVDKWSGSLEVGVTYHNPANLKFPSTMTNMDSGTIMMSGSKVLFNGHGNCIEYGTLNLDELKEGDTVGMMRKSNGELHYFINGIDQGAATNVDQPVWGVIDIYGMTVKVTIIDPYEDVECIEIPNDYSMLELSNPPGGSRHKIDEESLLFHSLRDSHVAIINNGKTAHRPNAFEYFNNSLAMTNRPLFTNELFLIRIDLVINKWAGGLEIGVTDHNAREIQYRFKLSNSTSGTWILSGRDIMRDATIINPSYSINLDRLVEGDTVGLMRKDRGILHFFINGVDHGPAAFNVPERVFGIIDLYGRIAQATIIDTQVPPRPSPNSESNLETHPVDPDLCFHRVHGRNATLNSTCVTAYRSSVYSEFNDAVMFSARPLRECCMFEVRIDCMVDCWIGSLEIGVTAITPEDLEVNGLAGTATDLCWDTYILSGSAIMKDGECIRSGYPLDLDTLNVGSRIGMMWLADRSLHFYLDGMDMGKAWTIPHTNIHAVVDVYGQCTQVTILQSHERLLNYSGNRKPNQISIPRPLASPPLPYWSFSEYCGENIILTHDYTLARRLTPDPMSSLVFSSAHLALGEIFEIKILDCKYSYAGSFRMGVTDVNILNAHVNRSLPPTIAGLPHYTAYIDGRYMRYSKPGIRQQDLKLVVPSFEWLRDGDRIGFKKTTDSKVLVYYNCELIDTPILNVPDKVYVVMEISGSVYKIQAVTRGNAIVPAPPKIPFDWGQFITDSEENSDAQETSDDPDDDNPEPSTSTMVVVEPRRRPRTSLPYTFHYIHGKNVKLCSSDTVAMRTSGYQDGVAIVSQPLRRGYKFRFRVDKIDDNWDGSLCIGAVPCLPSESVPESAMRLDPPAWVVSSDLKYNGHVITSQDVTELEEVGEQTVLTLHFRFNSELYVDIDGNIIGAIGYVPRNFSHVYPLVDLYGRISQISVLLHPYLVVTSTSLDLPVIVESRREDELLTEPNLDIEEDEAPPIVERVGMRRKWKPKASSHGSLKESYDLTIEPGSIKMSNALIALHNDMKNKEIRNRTLSVMHQSLILNATDNKDASLQGVQRSHSTNEIIRLPETDHSTFPLPYMNQHAFDTNIRHNERFSETNDGDYLDSEIMDALGLEPGNMPDLSEEPSSSIDESTRRDDFSSDTLTYETLFYIHKILKLNIDHEPREQESHEAEWRVLGQNCEHLRVTLKYWFDLVVPFQPLRHELCSGQVKCYCIKCNPNVAEDLAGWVCIEKRDAGERTSQGFWRMSRTTLSMAQAVCMLSIRPQRPRLDRSGFPSGTGPSEFWVDDERKGYQVLMAVELDVEDNYPQGDRLRAFWIQMKCQGIIEEFAEPLILDE